MYYCYGLDAFLVIYADFTCLPSRTDSLQSQKRIDGLNSTSVSVSVKCLRWTRGHPSPKMNAHEYLFVCLTFHWLDLPISKLASLSYLKRVLADKLLSIWKLISCEVSKLWLQRPIIFEKRVMFNVWTDNLDT